MMKRVIILELMVCSLLVGSTCLVSAADVTLTVDDDENDVIDMSTLKTVSRPNIDIKEVTCIQDGNEVELKLKLVEGGIIQDAELIVYFFYLTTSDHGYEIGYANKECLVTDEDGNEIDVEDCSGSGENELQVTFMLTSSDEECSDISGSTFEIVDLGTYEYYVDSAPDEYLDFLEVDAGGPYSGQAAKQVQFSGSAGEGTPPYTYQWDFGDGGTSDSQNPKYTYEKAGTYEVYLLVIDSEEKQGFSYTTANITAGSSANGDSDSGSDSGLIMFIVIIAIIVIAGVAVLVYVIRR